MSTYSFTRARIFQWMGILLALGVIAVSYWYFSVRAGVKLNTSEVQSNGSGRLESGLGLYYAFDEGSGSTVNDLSSNIYDGTTNVTWAAGQIGQAGYFDGLANVSDSDSGPEAIDFTDGEDFTMAAWFNRDTFTSDDAIIARRTGISAANNGYILYIDDATDKLTFEVSDGTDEYQLESVSTFTSTGWHHFAIVWDQDSATGSEIYIDGIANSAADTGTIGNIGDLSNTRVIALGAESDAGNPFDGKLDELQIYERVLAAAQIQSLYKQGQSDETNTGASQPQGTGRLDSGLAGYWKMDDGSGTSATDSSTNANTGTLTNGPTWTTGQIGGAVSFDGTDDYIDAGDQSSLEVNGNSLSIGGWFRIGAYPSGNRAFLITKGGASSSYYEYELSINGFNSNKFRFAVYNSTGISAYIYVDSNSVPALNTWFHVLAIWDKDTVSARLYFNGALENTSTTTSGSLHTNRTSNFNIGRRSDSAETELTGKADEVRIYNRVLSSDEVADLYRLTSPSGTDTSLKGYWSFNGKDISGTTAYDRSGAGNNGTLTNGPAVIPGKVGQALSFDGSNDYVDAGDSTLFEPSQNVTLLAWIYPTASGSYPGIITKSSSNGESLCKYSLYLYSSTRQLAFAMGGNSRVSTNLIVPLNQWSLVAVTQDGSGLTLYLNGDSEAFTILSAPSYSTESFKIGTWTGSSQMFTGKIDEVRIYNTALTAAQIQSLYKQGQADEVNTGASQAQGTGRLDSGLAGYWKMDDGSGTSATDSSTNANTGTLTNGPTWTTGQIGGAVDFDGTNDYLTVPDSSALDMTSDVTVSAWFKADTWPSGYAAIANKNGNYILRKEITPNDNLVFYWWDGSRLRYAQSSMGSINSISTGVWHHIAAVAVGNAASAIYIDGVLFGSGNGDAGAASRTLTNPLEIGGDSGAGSQFDGKIDEVRIYNRALSADEVAQLYRLTSPTGVDTTLKGYWTFNGKDISGTTAYDRSGAGNNGTLTNGPTVSPGKVGQALSFDGSNDYVNIGDVSSVEGVSQISMSAWIKPRSLVDYGGIISKYTGLFSDLTLNLGGGVTNGNTAIAVSIRNGSNSYGYTNAGYISVNNWTFVTFVFDGTQTGNANRLKIYINGTEVALSFSGTIPATTASNDANLNIGKVNTIYFDGTIDEPRIYNTALTATQIQALYNAGK